jgi:hypothetical protein
MPGETREIAAQFPSRDALKGGAQLNVTGWNIESATIPLPRGTRTAIEGSQKARLASAGN